MEEEKTIREKIEDFEGVMDREMRLTEKIAFRLLLLEYMLFGQEEEEKDKSEVESNFLGKR